MSLFYVRHCWYNWRYYSRCRPSNFATLRRTISYGLDIIVNNQNKYNSYGKRTT